MGNKNIMTRLGLLSRELYLLAPWKFMEETDLFCVETRTGKEYFISIMGSAGEVLALSAYKGCEGLYRFWNIFDVHSGPENVLIAPHILLSFNDKNLIQDTHGLPEPVSVNMDIPGATAHVVDIIPGLFPKAPEASELTNLCEILEQSLGVCNRAAKDRYFLFPEENEDDVYLTRKHFEENGFPAWYDKYIKYTPDSVLYKIAWEKVDLEQLSILKPSRTVLQIDFRLLPNPINEKSKPAYFPFALLTINKGNGCIEAVELMEPFPDYDSMLSMIPATVLKLIINLRFKPMSIQVRNKLLHEMLSQLFAGTGIKTVLSPDLPECDDAFSDLIQSLG